MNSRPIRMLGLPQVIGATGLGTSSPGRFAYPLHHDRVARLCVPKRLEAGCKHDQLVSEVTWISVTDAAPQFGMTPGAIMNLISRNKFPVPTYKLGKRRVIDVAVLRAFFETKSAEGLSRLGKSVG